MCGRWLLHTDCCCLARIPARDLTGSSRFAELPWAIRFQFIGGVVLTMLIGFLFALAFSVYTASLVADKHPHKFRWRTDQMTKVATSIAISSFCISFWRNFWACQCVEFFLSLSTVQCGHFFYLCRCGTGGGFRQISQQIVSPNYPRAYACGVAVRVCIHACGPTHSYSQTTRRDDIPTSTQVHDDGVQLHASELSQHASFGCYE